MGSAGLGSTGWLRSCHALAAALAKPHDASLIRLGWIYPVRLFGVCEVALCHLNEVLVQLHGADRSVTTAIACGTQSQRQMRAAAWAWRWGQNVWRVFERITEETRQVLVLAQTQARELRHNYIGTEHLLLGLLLEDRGAAGRVLASLGLDPVEVKASVLRMVPASDGPSRQIPFTATGKKVLERALRQALRLQHKNIGTEHVLLALAEESDGVAATILHEQQVSAEQIQQAVLKQWGTERMSPETPMPEMRHPIGLAWLDGTGPALNQLGQEIRRDLGRDPDAADLLLILACADGLAAETFRQLGLDAETLMNAVRSARLQHTSEDAEIGREIEAVRKAKEQAIEAQQLQRASELRDQERELSARLRGLDRTNRSTYAKVRSHLGLKPPPAGPHC